MKETKRVWKFFQYRECDAFAAYLEKMALEGWHLETVGFGMTFKKGEPKKVRYEIEVFSKAAELDVKAEPAAEEFSDYCETAGWEFVCAFRKFCIYRTENPDVVPIETDEMQRFENIKKASMSFKRNALLYSLFICCFQLFRFSAYGLLDTLLVFLWLFLLGVSFWELLVFGEESFWGYRTRKMLMAGRSISYEKESRLMKLLYIIPPILLTAGIFISAIYEGNYYAVITLVVLSLIFLCYHMIRIKLKLSREHSYVLWVVMVFVLWVIGVTIIIMQARAPEETVQQDFSHIEIPIHSYEFTGTNNTSEKLIEYHKDGNFLSSREYYQIEYGRVEKFYLWYEIIESQSDWVLNRFWNDKLHPRLPEAIHDLNKDNYKILEDEAKRWDAVSFAQLDFIWREYLIRYPDRVIVLHYDGGITTEIIEKIKHLKIEK